MKYLSKSMSIVLSMMIICTIPVKAEEPRITTENNESLAHNRYEVETENEFLDKTKSLESDDFKKETKDLTQSTITNESELRDAILTAQGEVHLVIQGGLEIELTDELVINTDNVSKLTLSSSDSENVVLKNQATKYHIVYSGSQALKLSFDGVSLEGDADHKKGGIKIVSDAEGHELNGLLIRNVSTDGVNRGVVEYRNNGAGSLAIKDSNFENNSIDSKVSVNSAILLVENNGGTITLENTHFDYMTIKGGSSGSISMKNSGGVAVLRDVSITNSTTNLLTAGLIYVGSGDADLKIIESEFSGNTNTQFRSAAIDMVQRDASKVLFRDTKINDNYAEEGGSGIVIDIQGNNTSLEFDNVLFSNNTSGHVEADPNTGESIGTSSQAGALSIYQYNGTSKLLIHNTVFSNNQAVTGGALSLTSGANGRIQTDINNTIFEGNNADYRGGAMMIHFEGNDTAESLIRIENSKIVNNTVSGRDAGNAYFAGGQGGGIYFSALYENPNMLELNHVEFSNNRSKYPMIWDYSPDSTDAISQQYTNKIKNTTYSTSLNPYVGSYNNAFNGDDINFDHNALMQFYINKDNITDLDLQNFVGVSSHSYNTAKGRLVLPITEPISTNYTFLGWYDENDVEWDFSASTVVLTYQKVYAKWERKHTYTANFDLNGAVGTAPASQTVVSGGKLQEPTKPVRPGYQFKGWSLTQNNPSTHWDFALDTISDANITLYAQWELNPTTQYTANFDLNGAGGTAPASQTVASGGKLQEPTKPVRPGYQFKGWSLTQDNPSTLWDFSLDTISNANITLYAQWESKIVNPVVPEVTDPEIIQPDVKPKPVEESQIDLPATGIEEGNQFFSYTSILLGIFILVANKKKKSGVNYK